MRKRWPKLFGHPSHYHRRITVVDCFVTNTLLASSDTLLLVVIEKDAMTRKTKLLGDVDPVLSLRAIEVAPVDNNTAPST